MTQISITLRADSSAGKRDTFCFTTFVPRHLLRVVPRHLLRVVIVRRSDLRDDDLDLAIEFGRTGNAVQDRLVVEDLA